MKYYIKQRYNPQHGTYHVPLGKLPAKEAKKHLDTLYGMNSLLSYKTLKAYKAAATELCPDKDLRLATVV